MDMYIIPFNDLAHKDSHLWRYVQHFRRFFINEQL